MIFSPIDSFSQESKHFEVFPRQQVLAIPPRRYDFIELPYKSLLDRFYIKEWFFDNIYGVELSNAIVVGNHTVLDPVSGTYYYDLMSHAGRHSTAFKDGSYSSQTIDIDINSVTRIVREPVTLLFHDAACGAAHSHWLIQSFPKAFWSLKKYGRSRKLVVMSTIKSYQITMLNEIGYQANDIIIRDAHEITQFLDLVAIYTSNDFNMDFMPYETIKKNVLNSNQDSQRKKIYVSRGAKRGPRFLVNEAEVILYLKNFGYEDIRSEELTLRDQVDIFSNASHVIAPIGAGVYNLVYNNYQNTKVLSISAPTYMTDWILQLCSKKGWQHSYLFGESFSYFDPLHFGSHSNWYMDLNLLKKGRIFFDFES